MPGDQASWGGQRTEKIVQDYNRPELTDQETIYEATKQCYLNTRQLFQNSGFSTMLVTVGDHELGGNEGFPVSGRKSKVETIPNYRKGFAEGYNFNFDGNSTGEGGFYWYPERIFDSTITSKPIGTPYEGTSFAYIHKNAIFVTIDAFEKVGDSNFIDRVEGTGGEGSITCTVTGAHLTWFESVLSAAKGDQSIRHIFVQAHVPIQQPVRKVKCSGQFLDKATASDFWKTMETYNVDIYFAGEVHSNTASQSLNSNLIQIVTRSNRLNCFTIVSLTNGVVNVTLYNEVGEKPQFNGQYVRSGQLVIDKSNGQTQITSSGDLELVDSFQPILVFDFEDVFPLGDRQVGQKKEL